MLLTLPLPRIGEYMTSAVIKKLHAAEGTALTPRREASRFDRRS